jgi:ATP-binding cassette subfamily B protein RaxB
MNLLSESTNARILSEKMGILFRSANALVFGVQSVLIIWFGTLHILDGSFTIGMLFAFIAYQEIFKARMATFVDRCFELRMLSIHLHRLADIAFEKTESLSGKICEDSAPDASIEFRDVSFRYSDTEPWILSGASFRINPGECVAIVGSSGAGKSTLLKLIAGLLQPQRGEVILGGHSVAIDRVSASSKVGFVLQDDCLFSGTISENIAFAAEEVDLVRVAECARIACVDQDIKAMPMGYSTLVGDMGAALSGGQQQRILLARALYQEPSILVLDEATSYLDIATEKRVAQALSNLGITMVLAAHRPNTIAIASRIMSLSRDGILETDCLRGEEIQELAAVPGNAFLDRAELSYAGSSN